jgi:hypothetical protein
MKIDEVVLVENPLIILAILARSSVPQLSKRGLQWLHRVVQKNFKQPLNATEKEAKKIEDILKKMETQATKKDRYEANVRAGEYMDQRKADAAAKALDQGKKEIAKILKGIAKNESIEEKWSAKYKRSINCNNPKGFSQKAHCAGRKKKESIEEGYKLQLERDPNMYVLHIMDTKTGKRTEVRGKKGYESGNYDPDDKLHQLLDTVGKSANIAELINGEVVTINPKHPNADRAKAATDKAYNESKSADLYHSTHDDESFVSILKSGAIKPNFDHEHTTEKDPRPYISLSRDKRFDMFGSLPITLVIDQTKLGSSHKIVPYDSFASDDDFEKRSSGSSEAEERVYKPIPISYIKYVILRNANWIDSEAVLAAAKAANIPVVDLNGKPITENFADGKKKGKSRPGRVKKAGASCKGSVTSLRKKAAKYSGEKGKMYHWCANMKGGKK